MRWRKATGAGRARIARFVVGRGTAQGIAEYAVTVMLFFGVVFGAADFAVWLHAQNATVAAVQEAAAVAAREDGTGPAAEQVGRELLQAALGPGAARVQVHVEVGDDVVTADAQGSWAVAPFGLSVGAPVHARAVLTRERFRPWSD
jgi:hypothetical protein